MFSWLLKVRKWKNESIAVPKRSAVVLGSETFLFEGLPPGQDGEPFRRVNARICEMKTLLARQETTITVQQETIVELNSKIRILEQQVDEQTTFVDQYGDLLEKMPNLVATFISTQAKKISHAKTLADETNHLKPGDPPLSAS